LTPTRRDPDANAAPARDILHKIVVERCNVSDPSEDKSATVRDNRAKHRFEISVNGDTAFLLYERTDDVLTLIHTEVPTAFRGHHVGEALVKGALEAARSDGLRIVALCPFVRAYMRKHPPPR
jgi:predicted GNAT family acetyltransferase